jgi:superfamily II DNA or RNA helicase
MVTDADDEAMREAVITRLEDGSTHVVVNCFLLSYGVDVPSLECIVLARPTRSLAMYLQMVGRGLRPFPGKEHCLLIDHGRVVESLGLPHAEIDWTLDEGRNVNVEAAKRARAQTTEKPRACPECLHTWLVSEGGNACAQCGWIPAPKARGVAVQEADLAELEFDDSQATVNLSEVERFYREAIGYRARTRPQKWREKPNTVRAAAWHSAREKFKLQTDAVPARFWKLDPLPPSATTAGWCKHRDIRWAKSKARATA